MSSDKGRGPNRTLAREAALRALFPYDVCRKLDEQWRPGLDDALAAVSDLAEDPDVREYAAQLVRGVIENLEQLDARIEAATNRWKLGRLATVDRCVLRLALFELLFSTEVPPKVTINEAINLAKQYSTEQSGAFVNGVLDRLYNESSQKSENSG